MGSPEFVLLPFMHAVYESAGFQSSEVRCSMFEVRSFKKESNEI
jgi:hypothetical protein